MSPFRQHYFETIAEKWKVILGRKSGNAADARAVVERMRKQLAVEREDERRSAMQVQH